MFNQAQALSLLVAALFFVAATAARGLYTRGLSADSITAALAADYPRWFVPALALQFGVVSMGAALRGTGNFKPGMVVQSVMVTLDMILAPFLIFGWVTHRPMGVAGAALATLIAVSIGAVWLLFYFMPVVAMGFAVAPVAGQNFGARQAARVRETMKRALGIAVVVMLVLAVASTHIAPAAMIRLFSRDPQVIAVGDEYLRIVSWHFIAAGAVFVASSMFQAIGNTVPSLICSFVLIVVAVVPALALARHPAFHLRWAVVPRGGVGDAASDLEPGAAADRAEKEAGIRAGGHGTEAGAGGRALAAAEPAS